MLKLGFDLLSASRGGDSAPLRNPASLRPAPHLAHDQIHVWTLGDHRGNQPADIPGYASLLSRDEIDRAARFRFAHLYDRFVSDHGRLRLLLSAYLESDPRSIVFAVNEYGKPRIQWPNCNLRFNMSHSAGVTMVALCLDAEIGIDVEAIRPVDEWEAIAASHFSSDENDAISAEPSSTRTAAFFRCWTRKEAFIKAKGMGLSLPLSSFSVSVHAGTPMLTRCNWDKEETSCWWLTDLEPGAGFAGSLAVERRTGNARHWATRHFVWPESTSRA